MTHTCTNEARLTTMEQKLTLADTNIKHLVERLDSLTKVLTTIAMLICSCMLTALGYLITFWVQKGGM